VCVHVQEAHVACRGTREEVCEFGLETRGGGRVLTLCRLTGTTCGIDVKIGHLDVVQSKAKVLCEHLLYKEYALVRTCPKADNESLR